MNTEPKRSANEAESKAGLAASGLVQRPVRFTLAEANKAGDEWRFNCGPAALCAVLDMTLDEIRPKLGDFERKGYSNPTLVKETLTRCGAAQFLVYRADMPGIGIPPRLDNALVRVQWSGPWTRPGVPMRVRYRQTHWIGVRNNSTEVFDINAMCIGGWMSRAKWESQLVPWLIGACVSKGDGGWWPTHALAVTRNK
jgi:hypothetical protein